MEENTTLQKLQKDLTDYAMENKTKVGSIIYRNVRISAPNYSYNQYVYYTINPPYNINSKLSAAIEGLMLNDIAKVIRVIDMMMDCQKQIDDFTDDITEKFHDIVNTIE